METVKEDDSPAEDEGKHAMPETQSLLNMGAFSQESENQTVREELMKLVDIVEETFEDGTENNEKGESSRGGAHKHVHVVIQETKNEIKDLTTENKVLQRRLLALQKRRSTIGTKLFLEGAETQYQIVARDARHIMSGKRLSNKLLDELQAKDTEADVDIERLRIEGRQLASQLKKTQLAILKKDQLSDSLFAVDFEQLKIENESLNEKLSKKIKELAELGKKTTHIVHVLSHSRERLEFVHRKIKADTGLLESLETELSKARSELQLIRLICEKLRSKRERIQMTVNVRTLPLLDDMEAYRDEAKFSERKLKELKHQYDILVKHIHKMQSQVCQEMASCFIESQILLQPANNSRSLRWGASNQILPRKAIV